MYWYAQTMYLNGQYHRAINQMKHHGLDKVFSILSVLKYAKYVGLLNYSILQFSFTIFLTYLLKSEIVKLEVESKIAQLKC